MHNYFIDISILNPDKSFHEKYHRLSLVIVAYDDLCISMIILGQKKNLNFKMKIMNLTPVELVFSINKLAQEANFKSIIL
jgi:hypothetical protein